VIAPPSNDTTRTEPGGRGPDRADGTTSDAERSPHSTMFPWDAQLKQAAGRDLEQAVRVERGKQGMRDVADN